VSPAIRGASYWSLQIANLSLVISEMTNFK
jgi:hypothetical protein